MGQVPEIKLMMMIDIAIGLYV